jgi:Cd2+/Zn2+-exporting ATPase
MIGSRRLMKEQQVPVPTGAQELEGRLQAAGKTTTLVAVDGQVEGILALADTLRPDALEAIRALRQMGVSKTVILTGDNARVASAIAEQAGVTLVRAELMPEDKVTTIRALRDEFGPTAMVGDGVNDAPALAHATVGIAMGGAGTDVALETADVALMGDDLSRLPFAVGLGRATRAIIRQNLAISLGVIALLTVASLTGLSGMGAAILVHEGSTLLVVTNALRLLGYTGGPASPRGA